MGGDPVSYGPGDALVVVDVQNDFAHPDGSLFVAGGDAVVQRINAEIDAALRGGALVVYTQDWHPSDTPHFVDRGGTWPVHCVRDTWGAELHAELTVVGGAPLVRKGTGEEDGYSGFTVRDLDTDVDVRTELDATLRDARVQRIVVVGIATDVCVKATVLDGVTLGYDTTVLADATAGVELEPGDSERALAEMAAAGATVS
jgi:nicotinamidase/pyrazinamidase